MNLIEELIYWREKSSRKHDNKKEKEQYYKKCYELCEKAGWLSENIEPIGIQIGLSYKTIKNNAREYALSCLHISKKEYNEEMLKIVYESRYADVVKNSVHIYSNDKYYNLLESLVYVSNDEEIIGLIDNYTFNKDVNLIFLMRKIIPFVFDFYPEQKETLVSQLEKKIDIYLNFKKCNGKLTKENVTIVPRKTELMLDTEKYLKLYIESGIIRIEHFCMFQEISVEYFNKLVANGKKQNSSIYQEYSKIYEKRFEFFANEVAKIVKDMVAKIKNGIIEKNNIRNFDIIDYYMMTDLNFKDCSKYIKDKLSNDEIRVLKKFFENNFFAQEVCENDIYKISVTQEIKIGYKLNNNSEFLYYPSEDEIDLIVMFMKNNGIPLNRFNYSIVLKRYLNTGLDFGLKNNNKTYVLK